VAVAALHACFTDVSVLIEACRALYYINSYGGADARAAICAFDVTLMDTLHQASDVMRAGVPFYGDIADLVLYQLR
jgi:hypothetical protein